MINKLIKKHGKKIITPSLTSAFLYTLSLLEYHGDANYFASFLAEGLVIVSIYLLSKREEKRLKQEMNDSSNEFNNLLDAEIKKAAELIKMLGNGIHPEMEQAKKNLSDLMKEKSDLIQKQIKKIKEGNEAIESKYNKAVKDTEDAEQDLEDKINSIANKVY